jgi:hypothetical protein
MTYDDRLSLRIEPALRIEIDKLKCAIPFKINELIRRAIWKYLKEVSTNGLIEGYKISDFEDINKRQFERSLEVIKIKEILSSAFYHRRFFSILCKMVSAKCTKNEIVDYVKSSLLIADTYKDGIELREKICKIIKVENVDDIISQIRAIQFNFKERQDIKAIENRQNENTYHQIINR